MLVLVFNCVFVSFDDEKSVENQIYISSGIGGMILENHSEFWWKFEEKSRREFSVWAIRR